MSSRRFQAHERAASSVGGTSSRTGLLLQEISHEQNENDDLPENTYSTRSASLGRLCLLLRWGLIFWSGVGFNFLVIAGHHPYGGRPKALVPWRRAEPISYSNLAKGGKFLHRRPRLIRRSRALSSDVNAVTRPAEIFRFVEAETLSVLPC